VTEKRQSELESDGFEVERDEEIEKAFDTFKTANNLFERAKLDAERARLEVESLMWLRELKEYHARCGRVTQTIKDPSFKFEFTKAVA
jgi:hypothetical protein